jgi:hypothetical protein
MMERAPVACREDDPHRFARFLLMRQVRRLTRPQVPGDTRFLCLKEATPRQPADLRPVQGP